jgi:hypothetical protein
MLLNFHHRTPKRTDCGAIDDEDVLCAVDSIAQKCALHLKGYFLCKFDYYQQGNTFYCYIIVVFASAEITLLISFSTRILSLARIYKGLFVFLSGS